MKIFYESPIGCLEIKGNGRQITAITVVTEKVNLSKKRPAYLQKCVKELEEYFQEGRKTFSIDLDFSTGTVFQQKVWRELLKIPYGTTSTYLKIAEKVSTKKAVRAVGGAIGRNPFFIINPCHRVIGTDGSLRGFAYGLESKRYLLELEKSEYYGKQNKLF